MPNQYMYFQKEKIIFLFINVPIPLVSFIVSVFLYEMRVWLVVYCLTSLSRVFHSYGDANGSMTDPTTNVKKFKNIRWNSVCHILLNFPVFDDHTLLKARYISIYCVCDAIIGQISNKAQADKLVFALNELKSYGIKKIP